MITGVVMVAAMIVFFLFALWHPTATAPFPPIVMKTGVLAILITGLVFIAISVIMKIRAKVKPQK